MHWSTYWALKNLFPSHRWLTFFTAMSVIGVTLGVAVLVVVQSVMNGFQDDIRLHLVETQGEIRIEGRETVIDPYGVVRKIQKFHEIQAASPYACGVVMLVYDGHPAFPFVKGIAPEEEFVTGIGKMLTHFPLKNFSRDHIILGEQLAQKMGIHSGDIVELYSPLSLESLQNNEIIFPRELEVVDFFSSDDYSQNAVLCSLERVQELYQLGDCAHGVTIKLKPNISVEKFAIQLQESLGSGYRVIDWINDNGPLLFALRWEKTMMFFVLLFILLVSSFSISSMLITGVVRKTREIGVMIAMGGSTRSIAFSFCLQSGLIGAFGVALGMVGGIFILHYRDLIVKYLHIGLTWEGARNYLSQFTHLPVSYRADDFIFIGLFSLVICIISAIIPAWKASRIHPAVALRYEQ